MFAFISLCFLVFCHSPESLFLEAIIIFTPFFWGVLNSRSRDFHVNRLLGLCSSFDTLVPA